MVALQLHPLLQTLHPKPFSSQPSFPHHKILSQIPSSQPFSPVKFR
ncbi:hypothetical protein M6B38_274155 [Iris pallida]|uniref:Uncharacterized protein n=1 Tax=Iris pallida TaxID=29817 RepID=A0AAX6I543_IRIPA|nr:hypothetical protein M6B38_274155 [Iris pallida]